MSEYLFARCVECGQLLPKEEKKCRFCGGRVISTNDPTQVKKPEPRAKTPADEPPAPPAKKSAKTKKKKK